MPVRRRFGSRSRAFAVGGRTRLLVLLAANEGDAAATLDDRFLADPSTALPISADLRYRSKCNAEWT
jgi:hypothetical protein